MINELIPLNNLRRVKVIGAKDVSIANNNKGLCA